MITVNLLEMSKLSLKWSIDEMKIQRFLKLLTVPTRMIYAYLFPELYAKKIGVDCFSDMRIYGSSYYMFSAEPYLVSLGKNVHISREACFICHDGSTLPFRKEIPDLELAGEIKIGNNVFIGKGAVVLANVSIGDNCVVGAHAVVTKNVPNGCVVAGNPAKIIKNTNEFLAKAEQKSLKIGHLKGEEKVVAYKRIFNKR